MEDFILRYPFALVLVVGGLIAVAFAFLAVNKRRWKQATTAGLEEATSSLAEAIAVLLFWLGLIFLVVAIPVAPHLKSTNLNRKHQDGVARLAQAAHLLFDSDEIRIETRRLGNVVVWVERSSFEGIPYPDRDGAVNLLAQAWCPAFPTLPFFPSLYVKDIRNGKRIASHLCTERVLPR